MGNPYLKLGDKTVLVDGFFFNIGMTVFREEHERQQSSLANRPVLSKVSAYIINFGYEDIMDTVFHFDEFVANEKNRADLMWFLQGLIKTVLQPAFQLPDAWQKLMSGKIGGTPPIPITHNHYLGIAYIYQVMLDLIEGKIVDESLVRPLQPPPDWQPDT